MIASALSHLTSAALVAADDGGPAWLLLLGPAGGGAFYYGYWRFYRNTHQSHGFEHETRVTAQPITGGDRKIDEIKGTTKSGIDNDNKNDHRERVQRIP